MPAAAIRPVPRLPDGSRVALVAPAGTLTGPEDVERGESNARSLGWEPRTGPNVLRKHRYFAGTDAERLRDLNDAIRDDEIDGIWCLRGGYGAMRLLPDVDFDALARCRGIVFGECTDCHETSASGTREVDEILTEIAELAQVPCIAGAPIGHIDDQWTLPIGARARFDADARTLNVIPFTREPA